MSAAPAPAIASPAAGDNSRIPVLDIGPFLRGDPGAAARLLSAYETVTEGTEAS